MASLIGNYARWRRSSLTPAPTDHRVARPFRDRTPHGQPNGSHILDLKVRRNKMNDSQWCGQVRWQSSCPRVTGRQACVTLRDMRRHGTIERLCYQKTPKQTKTTTPKQKNYWFSILFTLFNREDRKWKEQWCGRVAGP